VYNLALHPSLHASETAQPQQSMNQYEMDDYVLPRRRSPWVLVGRCSPAVHSRMVLWPYTLLREVCAAAIGRQRPACMFAECRRWRNCCYFAGRLIGFQKGQCTYVRVSRVRLISFQSVLTWMGLQGNQNLSQHMMRARVVAQVSSSLLVPTLVSASVLLVFQ